MLKKGYFLVKLSSILLLLAILFGIFRGDNILNPFESLTPEQTDALLTYAENSGHALPDSVVSKLKKTYVAKITASMAETFSGTTTDDFSSPTNSYLPRGTVDYCNKNPITDPVSRRKYYLLNCGYRIYADTACVEISEGRLPESNEINFSIAQLEGKRLNINFKTEMRVPFMVVFGEQRYKNPSAQDYEINSADFTYIDIIFYNTQDFGAKKIKLPENRIFKEAKQIKNNNKNEITLRFYLKKRGGFYGWNSYYNESGELVFSFLQPAQIEADSSSPYGYSLKGVKILIDPGHGGDDPGAANSEDDSNFEEHRMALLYAKQLSDQLKALGATVTYTRVTDTTVTLDDRYTIIRNANADLVISIHFNASKNKEKSGYFMGYFYPFASSAARHMSNAIKGTATLKPENGGTDWHYFRPSRVSSCPVILTENGYISCDSEYKNLKRKDFCQKYLAGMTKGIVDYFVSIS